MESRRERAFPRTKHKKVDITSILRKSWYHLRLSVRHPSRVPTWDAIVLTAASPEQAQLYEWQLNRAKRMGRIASSTITLAVPDPDAQRIGSGAATLNAIFALARHYQSLGLHLGEQVETTENGSSGSSVPHEESNSGDSTEPMIFLPLPFLAADDPDGPVPLLFDHILAIASCARQAFKNEGGILTMTGDVLPCFDASTLVIPEDASCIITVPITLDVASNHGVIVASNTGILTESYTVSLAENLLQKPSLEELVANEALLDDGRTLLDTGIIAARGKAWAELARLASSCEPMIEELLKSRKEMSLYEDLVAAWVPAKHEWLRARPLGEEMVRSLGKQNMFSYCAYDLLFLHLGTSSEVLDHLSGASSELVGRRHLCSIPATTSSDIAASAVVLSSKIEPGVSVGEDSLIYDSFISSGIQIGSLSVVVGINVPRDIGGMADDSFRFMLPDRHCLWEVPLVGCTERVIVYCGLHDNPKSSLSKDGTFCGKPWKKVLLDLGIRESDLWSSVGAQVNCLWNAKLFPILSYLEMLHLASWLMGLSDQNSRTLLPLWKSSRRVSLEELHRSIDFPKMCTGLKAYQVQVDLLRACGDETTASHLEHKVWAAVADETASAVRYGFKERILESPSSTPTSADQNNHFDGYVDQPFCPRMVKVELPVRIDFAGGWSDTPPWSLERAGCVLNMAIRLEGCLPIGTIIETTEKTGILINDDAGNQLYVENLVSIAPPFR
ncbi:hypothetical protein OIU77_010499 [Salix suchowensis]|uniref:GDP-fucose pyrophosphorylase domain-containing protein n=1 Tax=Salix suchowensis TaxID=1278906 RepID=A0ABQ9A8J5_9ROSI|nr:hypothetical protein OIU77_010499 [Salix suchowensis]